MFQGCRKMKIVFVSDWYYLKIGGVVIYMYQFVIYLKKFGYDVLIVINDLKMGKEKEFEELGVGLVKVLGVISLVFGINIIYGLKLNRELGEFFVDFDVVYVYYVFILFLLKVVKVGRIFEKVIFFIIYSIFFFYEFFFMEGFWVDFFIF